MGCLEGNRLARRLAPFPGRGEQCLEPQTDVTRSCDFSEDVSYFFERERRIYALINKAFAEALAALNAERAWTAADQSRSKKLALVAAVLTLAVVGGVAALLALTGR